MYKKVQPQGNIMVQVCKCIGVSSACAPRKPDRNFQSCSVHLPRSFQLFFPEHFLLVPPDLDCLFYLSVSVYIWIYAHRRQSKMLITCKSLSQPQGILLLLIHVLFCCPVGRQASVQWLESRTEVLGYLISKNVLLRKIRPCLQCRGILSPSVLRRSGDYISI